MSFTHKPATSEGRRLRLGIAGPSRSGKTYSALTLATGMMKESGKPIFFIDTENGFALDYAKEFQFQHVDFQPPFSAERYTEALQYCEAQGAGVVIVDSATHEHTGIGGVLESQEKICGELAAQWKTSRDKANMAAWQKAKRPHNKYVDDVQRCKVPIIFCFRAKDKIKIVNVNGKQEISHVGWTAICTEQFEYEMTALLILPPNSEGKSDPELSEIRAPLRHILKAGQQISQQMGSELNKWATETTDHAPLIIKGAHSAASSPALAPDNQDAAPSEFISADQVIVIGDLLAAHVDIRAKIVKRFGSVAKVPADKYDELIGWIKSQTGQE